MLEGSLVDALLIILYVHALAHIGTGVAACFLRLGRVKEIVVFGGWLLL